MPALWSGRSAIFAALHHDNVATHSFSGEKGAFREKSRLLFGRPKRLNVGHFGRHVSSAQLD